MKIAGLNKFTLSDFPETPSCIIFFRGCNFKCPFCHNSHLIPYEGSEIPKEYIFEFLNSHKDKLQGVVLSGGEPTFLYDIIDFARRCKNLGYKVKLDTNGSRPLVIKHMIAEELLDFIAMDVKAPFYKYSSLIGVQGYLSDVMESINIIKNSKIPHIFRTTFYKKLLTSEDISGIIADVGEQVIVQPYIKTGNIYGEL